MESKTNKTKSSVSAWFSQKPEGNRPNISAMIELTPEIVNTIVRNGEIGSHEMIQLRLACWKQPAQGNQPNHRGLVQFSKEQNEEFVAKSA
jgi:hypothetical protein